MILRFSPGTHITVSTVNTSATYANVWRLTSPLRTLSNSRRYRFVKTRPASAKSRWCFSRLISRFVLSHILIIVYTLIRVQSNKYIVADNVRVDHREVEVIGGLYITEFFNSNIESNVSLGFHGIRHHAHVIRRFLQAMSQWLFASSFLWNEPEKE